jgi:GxxExxY protein
MNTDQDLEATNLITEQIIGSAIEVHRHLGPGLLEQNYEAAMCIELHQAGVAFERQPMLSIDYKGARIGEHRADLIVGTIVDLPALHRPPGRPSHQLQWSGPSNGNPKVHPLKISVASVPLWLRDSAGNVLARGMPARLREVPFGLGQGLLLGLLTG